MKNTSDTIDRGALLLGGATAALSTILLGATKNKNSKFDCCEPIDLYVAGTVTTKSKAYIRKLRKRGALRAFSGPVTSVHLLHKKGNEDNPPDLGNGWTPIGIIPSPYIHGIGDALGDKTHDTNPPYDIWVYVK